MRSFSTDKTALTELIMEAQSMELQLPNFQRAYQWKPKAVMQLLDSIFKSHPAGAILLLEQGQGANTRLESVPVRSVSARQTDIRPAKLILDGQQRITSCHIAFTNSSTGKRTYYFDLKKMMELDEAQLAVSNLIDDKILVAKKHSHQPQGELYSNNLLPLCMLFDANNKKDKGHKKFRENLIEFKNNLRQKDCQESRELLNFLELRFESEIADAFYNYQFPHILLSKELDIYGVCKVFQTMNTTGLKLSAFDICVASFMPDGIRLKEDLTALIERHSELEPILNNDETIILQTIALLAGKSPKKNGLPSNLEAGHIRLHWDDAVKGLLRCVDALDRMGMAVSITTSLVPYMPVVPVLAATLVNDSFYPSKSPDQLSGVQAILKRWVMSVSLALRYTEGTDAKMAEDYKSLSDWLSQVRKPDYVDSIAWNSNRVKLSNKNGAFGKAILLVFNSLRPTDFYSNQTVGFGRGVSTSTQLHHVFPKAKYGNMNKDTINSVFNFALLTAESNNFISNNRTNVYIENLERNVGLPEFHNRLPAHCISDAGIAALKNEDFETFIVERVAMVKTVIENTFHVSLVDITNTTDDDDDFDDIDDNFTND